MRERSGTTQSVVDDKLFKQGKRTVHPVPVVDRDDWGRSGVLSPVAPPLAATVNFFSQAEL